MSESGTNGVPGAPGVKAPGARPWLGYGLGLRTEHFQHVLDERPAVDWFEVISENFMVDGGKPRHYLQQIRERYPLVMHGVSLSIGSTDPLDQGYLRSLKRLAREVEPAWISDHLCWTGVGGLNSHDLLPLPYTEEAISHVVSRVMQVQDFLGRELMLENVSTYLQFDGTPMPEWQFLREVALRSGCRILLDVNNIYVSARNHGFDPLEYVDAVPAEHVWQIHLAGHSDYGEYLIDTHDHPVCDGVWQLYRETLQRLGPVSSMIERDDDIPPLSELLGELDMARQVAAEALGEKAPLPERSGPEPSRPEPSGQEPSGQAPSQGPWGGLRA